MRLILWKYNVGGNQIFMFFLGSLPYLKGSTYGIIKGVMSEVVPYMTYSFLSEYQISPSEQGR